MSQTATATPPPAAPAKPAGKPIKKFEWNDADNPLEKPVHYLLARGWRSKGTAGSFRWYPPEDLDAKGNPRGDKEVREPVTINKIVSIQDPDRPKDPKAKIDKQVPMIPADHKQWLDAATSRGEKEMMLTTIIPGPLGYSRDEAVQVQIDRDLQAA